MLFFLQRQVDDWNRFIGHLKGLEYLKQKKEEEYRAQFKIVEFPKDKVTKLGELQLDIYEELTDEDRKIVSTQFNKLVESLHKK